MSKQNKQGKQSLIFEIVTNRIIEMLEAGTVPWRKPWASGGRWAVNWLTQRAYRGINQLLLPFGGEYATYKQIKEAGGRIKEEELKNGNIVIFCKPFFIKSDDEDADEEETETGKKFFMYRYYRVWEINTQCEGLKSKRPPAPTFEHDPIASAERIIEAYPDGPEIRFELGQAVYNSLYDRVSIPPITDFKIAEEYYSTFFHELVHSTGHAKRLNRDGITKNKGFRSDPYAFEELVAEIGAAMLCTEAGIDQQTLDNSAAYIDGWLSRLRNDKKLIIIAARHAQRAVDHILNVAEMEEAGA